MNARYEKLKRLLEELFQLDQPDLDFGLYRIMHAKSGEVTAFLDRDLLPQVKEAFALYQPADKAALEAELATALEQARILGVDPESSQKVKDLRKKIASSAVDIAALESDVFDKLYSFFRRYYSEGDFLSKRVYKEGAYAIPYEGEEVTLHWANKDQYYIKTTEYLRDYCFRLRPDDEAAPMRVHFRLVDAAEGEHGNVKAAEGKDRVFVLAAGGESDHDFLSVEDGAQGQELSILFEYRPTTLTDWPAEVREDKTRPPAQKDLTAFAVAHLLAVSAEPFGPWTSELGKPHVTTGGETADYPRLEGHLKRYTARNTFDYFIHKDLGTFLRRELDFYIKNEVMHLDDIENDNAPRVEQYLSKIRVIRRIAGKIIDFLAQLEDFQKKLWLKKKFVVETQWCIRIGCIPEEFWGEIAANDAQREEWVSLYAIDDIQGDLTTPGYSVPLNPEFFLAYTTLVVDTRHFDAAFTARLVEVMGAIDEQTDGVLFHSENFQALSLMQSRFRGRVSCIYIDPPYNTGSDFLYKDAYKHSTWASMISDRSSLMLPLCRPGGLFFCSIGDRKPTVRESHRLVLVLDQTFGEENFIANLVWMKGKESGGDASLIGIHHEYVVMYAMHGIDRVSINLDPKDTSRHQIALPEPNRVRAGETIYRDGELFQLINLSKQRDYRVTIPLCADSAIEWDSYCPQSTVDEYIRISKLFVGQNGVPYVKSFLADEKAGTQPSSLLEQSIGTTKSGGIAIREMFAGRPFDYPKPPSLIQRLLGMATMPGELVLDCFGGSGATGDASIMLAREGGRRTTFVLVEQAAYFDSILVPRLKKVAFTPEWKDGKPKRFATAEEADRSPRIMKIVRLESYEDTLNNLDIRRSDAQKSLLDEPGAKGDGKLREQYLLKYMLDVETRGSQSLLNVAAFRDPTAYRLNVKRPGSDENREVCVDLMETFNWLIGLTVEAIAAPQVFSAECERDEEGRLRLKDGRIKPNADGPYWFRRVEGKLPDGRRALVVWRKITDDIEAWNLVLDHFLTEKLKISTKDFEFDVIYVNGSNNLENLKAPDDTWKVRLLEEEFHRLMFATEDA